MADLLLDPFATGQLDFAAYSVLRHGERIPLFAPA
jgi:hypothetical protein